MKKKLTTQLIFCSRKMRGFQSYQWIVSKTDKNDSFDEIRSYCLDRDSKPVLIRLTDIPCKCYMEFRPGFLDSPKNVAAAVNGILSLIAPKTKRGKDYDMAKRMLLKVDVKRDVKFLYESRPGTVMALELINSKAMKRLHDFSKSGIYIQGGKTPYKIWEADVEMHIKLIAEFNMKFCQWFDGTITAVHSEDKITTLEHEYWLDVQTLSPIPLDQTTEWVVYPRMFSFDIEVYSANPNRFPLKEAASDVITEISCLFQRHDKPETIEKYILVHGECRPVGSDVKVMLYKTEKELLQGFLDLFIEKDPEIITGFNTEGFDVTYIDYRLSRKRLSWMGTSRVIGQEPFVKEQTTFSEAYRHKVSYLWKNMEGRIHIDLLSVVKRTHSKFRSFKLDFVSNEILGESKHDISPKQMFAIYKRFKEAKTPEELESAILERTDVAKYCIQDSMLVLKLFHEMSVWYGIVEMCNVVYCSPAELYTRGQQMKCNSQLYVATYNHGYVMDYVGTAYDYKGAYVKDPIPGIYDNVLGLDFASLYPSLMRAHNICYTTFAPNAPDDDCEVFDFDEVFENKVDIISPEGQAELERRQKEKQQLDEEEEDEDEDEDTEEYDSDQENHAPQPVKKSKGTASSGSKIIPLSKDTTLGLPITLPSKRSKKITITKKVHYHFKFLKSTVKEGLVPMIVRLLVQERNAVKEVMKKMKAEGKSKTLAYLILEKRQLALKVSANSMYGFMGVRKGIRPFIQGAITITYMGRISINMVNSYVESRGYKVVYNDTDSSYVLANVTDNKEVYAKGKALAAEISKIFPPPMVLEFEKPFRMLAVKKKKYAYIEINEQGEFERNKDGEVIVNAKGLTAARRDNCLFLTDNFSVCLENIMMYKSVLVTADVILTAAERLWYDQVAIGDLSINKALGSNYKSDTAAMKVFGDRLKDMGRPAEIGERLDFVIIEDKNSTTQGKKMRLLQTFVEDSQGEHIDKLYYLNNVFKNPIDQIYTVGYNHIWSKFPADTGFKFGTRKLKPMNLLVAYIVDSLEFDVPFSVIRQKYMSKLRTLLKTYN